MPAVALTALPLLLVAVSATIAALAVARSLRDDAVVEALRAEARSFGEVHRAVREVRAARTGGSTAR